jgi:ADP-heptose:LPS heptosyltransferase
VHERPDAAENSPELEAFFAEARRENFDLALQMHGGGRYSNPFVRRLGAGLTAGLKAPDAVPLDRWVPYVYFQPEILRLLEVVGLVGARPVALEPRLAVTEKDLEEAERAVPPASGTLVVLNPGAGDGRRRWPVEKFAQVGDALAESGAQVVVHGAEWERPLVEGVTSHMCAQAQTVCGSLSLGGLAGLLSRARLMVSNDSGPLHIAAAVGAATVGLYWCGNLITAGPMTRARHRPAISWRLNCPECGFDCTTGECGHHASFVADIRVEEVLASARELLIPDDAR